MPVESPYPRIDVPETDLWTFLFERKNLEYPKDKGKTSYQRHSYPKLYLDPYTPRSYSYATTKAAAISFGQGLKAVWDFQKNDVLCLYSPNCIDTPAITWGTHWAGGVFSPANPAYTAKELAFQLQDSKATCLVTQLAQLNIATQAAKIAGLSEDRIALIGDARDPNGRIKHFTSVRNISGAARYRRVKRKSSDLAFLVYSSGTTGRPKGVMLTHSNIIADLLQVRVGEAPLSWKGGPDDRGDSISAFLPFSHIYGLTVLVHQALDRGLRLIVMPRFDLEDFCAQIQKYRITFAFIAPPIVVLLAKSPIVSKYDLSSLRMINSGAAPLTKELVEAFHARLKVPIKQGYGMSEAAGTTHEQAWDRWDKPIGSVGVLLPNQTAKFVDPDGNELATGQTGEIWIKGPNVFVGYLNNEEGTKSSLTPDGYYKTGDVGHVDEHGQFHITDRVKELIKYKGYQVAPAELEGLLFGHEKIDDVCVVGIFKKDELTEVPRAYVVVKNGVPRTAETEKDIADWTASHVANHKKLRGGVKFVDSIPKSASGKILRRVLRLEAQKELDALKAKL